MTYTKLECFNINNKFQTVSQSKNIFDNELKQFDPLIHLEIQTHFTLDILVSIYKPDIPKSHFMKANI